MADKKGGLGRGIGALIPTSPTERPSDIFFGGGTPANTPGANLIPATYCCSFVTKRKGQIRANHG
jgi:ParB family chromosome partitioning protein